MDEATRISLKDQFNSLLVRAIEGRRGGMALMRVLEELDFYNSPASAKHHLTGAPQHERRNALFNPPRNKSGRPLPWPPRPALSCRAGLICGRIEDAPASDNPP